MKLSESYPECILTQYDSILDELLLALDTTGETLENICFFFYYLASQLKGIRSNHPFSLSFDKVLQVIHF